MKRRKVVQLDEKRRQRAFEEIDRRASSRAWAARKRIASILEVAELENSVGFCLELEGEQQARWDLTVEEATSLWQWIRDETSKVRGRQFEKDMRQRFPGAFKK